ncbi:hypothetical protein CCACVL1_21469 [Corchorus capsularis]|uniref:FBD domain-containing protein n=1 Tax=Corchorus capsularis TaxID=210143 RepID=A0A1R3H5J7_COCAP|nr:hypothetical protein CCACVL1_21469 [Corchorus capsularis]
MDDGVETSSSCRRQRVCEEEEEDRISRLPDSILIHILSFLPTIDAVRTVLVPRFRHLWHFLPTLKFDHYWYTNYHYPQVDLPFFHEKFLDFVRHVLILHQNATINKFVLKLELNLLYSNLGEDISDHLEKYANRERRMASEVDSWIHFAMRKNVKVLNLDFLEIGDSQPNASYRLPSVVFRGKYLTELKLIACEIKPIGEIQLNCLKLLSLKECVLNDEIIKQIISGCSVLEELSLLGCYGLSRLAFRNPSIKSLILYHEALYNERLEISCPGIETLDMAGSMELVDFVDVSSIVVSSTSFCFGLENSSEKYQKVVELLKKLSRGKMFRTCNECILAMEKHNLFYGIRQQRAVACLVFSAWQLINQPDLLFGWKYLEFELHPTKWHQPGISCLLRTSPFLESLAMYIYTESNQLSPPNGYEWMESHSVDGENFWSSQEGTFHCLQNHLKTVKLYGYITEPYVFDIIEFLLKNSMVLEKLEISTQATFKPSQQALYSRWKAEYTKEQRVEFSQKLFSLPRASTRAVILFSP